MKVGVNAKDYCNIEIQDIAFNKGHANCTSDGLKIKNGIGCERKIQMVFFLHFIIPNKLIP